MKGHSEQITPEGLSFLRSLWEQEDKCETDTDGMFPKLGRKAPVCLERIGTVLFYADGMASCWWKCLGGDHLIEYLCGRAASNSRAALRLIRFGFYDESLMLSRAIGETSNLLQLFFRDKARLDEWKKLPRKDRIKVFPPVKVRQALEGIGNPPLIREDRYRILSEKAVHVQPETKPQSQNVFGIPTTGAYMQEEGILVCLNELALPLAGVVSFSANILALGDDLKEQTIAAARSLVEQIGGATITKIDAYHDRLRKDPGAHKQLMAIEEEIRRLQRE